MKRLMTAQTDLMAILEDRGYRSTGPRRDVIDALEKRLDSFSAEDISGELQGVGRATVYRTIKLLLEAGVLCKLILPNGEPTYTIARLEHHHHTLCVRCGTVGEFQDATIEQLLRAIGGDISGEILGHRMEFFITCERCLAGSAV
jgi:Fe2+ or Zn2+ uptake regulation protein